MILNNSTAAHCVQDKEQEAPKDLSNFEMILGAHNLSDHSELGRKIAQIEELIIHKKWDSRSFSYEHDIALIILNETVEFDRFIQPIAISSTLGLEQFGKVTGWGAIDDDGALAEVAKTAELRTMNAAECVLHNTNLAYIFWQESFCAKAEDQGVCLGDSGSGFYFQIDGINYLKGVVSSSSLESCSKNEVVLYSDVSKYYDFIMVKIIYDFNLSFLINL